MRLILPAEDRLYLPGLVPFSVLLGPILMLWLPANSLRSFLCAALLCVMFLLPGLVKSTTANDKNCGSAAWVAFAGYQ